MTFGHIFLHFCGKVSKKQLFIFLIPVVLACSAGYETFSIDDLQSPAEFTMEKGQNAKPANIDLQISGKADADVKIIVRGIPSTSILLDTILKGPTVHLKGKLDYYEGNGVVFYYIPQGATRGELEIKARINSDF